VAIAASGTTRYVRPFAAEAEYKDVLPNVGLSYVSSRRATRSTSAMPKASVAPRTDNLYTAGVVTTSVNAPVALSDVDPETSQAWDLGYRFRSPSMIISAALWSNNFQNRIVSSFDPDLGYSVDRNVGDVKLWGIDAQAGWTPNAAFSLYSSVSYTSSELQDDLQLGRSRSSSRHPVEHADVPAHQGQVAGRNAGVDVHGPRPMACVGRLHGRLPGQARRRPLHHGRQRRGDPGYNVFDLDMRYDLPFGAEGTSIQLNVTNVFDEEYYGNISSGNNAKVIANVNPNLSTPPVSKSVSGALVSVGAPRTIQVTLRTTF
jgi:iron complex outermembrane receptor protein